MLLQLVTLLYRGAQALPYGRVFKRTLVGRNESTLEQTIDRLAREPRAVVRVGERFILPV